MGRHLGRIELVNSTVEDILVLEDESRIMMHILTPTRVWRFHFMSRDERSEWYEDIISRIKALEHPYRKLLMCRISLEKAGRLYSSWEERFIRLDNCFQIFVYSSNDDV